MSEKEIVESNAKNKVLELKARKQNIEKWFDFFQFKWWLTILFSVGGALTLYLEASKNATSDITLVKSLPVIALGGIAGIFIYGISVGYVKLLLGAMQSI